MGSSEGRWLLTGGIGSGKTAVRKLLGLRGIRTIDADAVGHAVLNEEGFAPIAERWPRVVVEGEIDRKALAGVVFAQRGELAALEAITHPFIFGRIADELEGFSGPAVVELPLIDSTMGWARMVVDADEETRMRRAVDRGMAEDDVRRRMAIQPSRAEWLASADLVVPNHDGLEELEHAVAAVSTHLLEG